jgi:ATP-dependent DNA helicase RecQ
MTKAQEILRNIFGYNDFRGNQAAIIDHMIAGKDA